MEKAVSCYKVDRLVASLLSFRTLSRHLEYANFVLQEKNAANDAMDGCVNRWYLMSWHPNCIRTQSQLCKLSEATFGFTMQEFSMVGSYMENTEKPQNWGWVLAQDNTVLHPPEVCWKPLKYEYLHIDDTQCPL